MSVPARPQDLFLILNGLERNAMISSDEKFKIVTR